MIENKSPNYSAKEIVKLPEATLDNYVQRKSNEMCTGQEVAEAARQLTESKKTIKEMNESTSDLIDNIWNSLDDRRKHLEEMKNDRK